MSLLSSVKWNIRLGHGAVRVRRREAGLTRSGWRVGETAAARGFAPAAGWQAALAALEQELGAEKGGTSAARVVLADSMVRYAVVPWKAALARADEETVFLRHRFGQLYDSETAGWELRIERPHGERPRLASAVDPALVAALSALLRERGIGLRSLVPALADSIDRVLSGLDAPAGWFVSHDAGSLSMARWEDGAWLSARCLRVDSDWRTALPGLLAREECMHEGQAEARTVYLIDEDGGGLPALPGWEVRGLSARPAQEDDR